jgi:putative ABC transport system permease protein
MKLLRSLAAGLRPLFHKTKADAELDEELRAYLDASTTQKMKDGMTEKEALRAARLEMGTPEAVKEEVHSASWEHALETLGQDIRFALRMLRKSPGFTIVAILTLTLGIGATTAIFSVVNTVLVQPMPYKQADELVTIWGQNKARGYTLDLVSVPDYMDWKSQNRVFESMGASTDEMFTLTGAGEPDAIIGYEFSPNFFDVLGVAALLGRTFSPDEDQPGKNHVVVLNYRLWKTRFGGDPGVIGKSITLDGQSYTVIGVMPRSFQYPESVQLWTPLTISPERAKARGVRWLRVMARLKHGATMTQAAAEMKTITARLRSEYPDTNKDYYVNLESLRHLVSGDVTAPLLALLCSVCLVLLIACANIANLLLSRATARQREIAIRVALGATPFRMVRQFLTESVLVSITAGGLGLLIAYWGAGGMVAMFPTTISNLSIPRVESIPIDRWVLGFALLASLLTGIVFGLVPALQAARIRPGESLKESGRSGAGGSQGRRFRNALAIAEVSLSLVLLVAAGLMIKSFLRLVGADLGFQPGRVLTMRVLLPDYKYKTESQQRAFNAEALRRIRALPGVQSAGTVTFLPLSGWWGTREVSVAGRAAETSKLNPRPVWGSASSGYFSAMRIPLIEGRYFTAEDNDSSAHVAILSASLARQLWPKEDPIGRDVTIEGFKGTQRVVGVVGDVYQLGLGVHESDASDVKTEVYIPFDQSPTPLLCLAVRTAADPLSVAKAAQTQIWAVDKEQAISFVESMGQLASETMVLQRASTILLGIFAALALVLAAIGIYGVISYSVSQRTHEIGIRRAVGANSADVLRLVIAEGLKLTLTGVLIGLAGALALTRFLSSLLFGVRAADPAILVATPAVLICVALLACYIPARRAMRVDPMVALRYE